MSLQLNRIVSSLVKRKTKNDLNHPILVDEKEGNNLCVPINKLDIDERNNFIIIGYLRQYENSANQILPPLIWKTCTSFYYDPNNDDISQLIVYLDGHKAPLDLTENKNKAIKDKKEQPVIRNIFIILCMVPLIVLIFGLYFLLFDDFNVRIGGPLCIFGLMSICFCGYKVKNAQDLTNTNKLFITRLRDGLLFNIQQQCVQKIVFSVDYGLNDVNPRTVKKNDDIGYMLHNPIIKLNPPAQKICSFKDLHSISFDQIDRGSSEPDVYFIILGYQDHHWRSDSVRQKQFMNMYEEIQNCTKKCVKHFVAIKQYNF